MVESVTVCLLPDLVYDALYEDLYLIDRFVCVAAAVGSDIYNLRSRMRAGWGDAASS